MPRPSYPDDEKPVRLKCDACGRFIADGKERVLFTPDSHFGPESIEILCAACDDRDRLNFRRIAGCERPR